MKRAPVAVIVVNWNRRELLLECLDSLMRQTVLPVEVIVVDNASTDGSTEAVLHRFGPDAAVPVRVIRSEANLGFAGGNNLGARAAKAEWLALLNNDAVADARWIEGMMRVAGAGVGLVGCRLVRFERRELLDNAGVGLWDDGMSRGASHYARDAEVSGPFAPLPSGAAMMVRRSAFESAGGFDESFFAYSEDTDLGIRVRLAGWEYGFAGNATAYHRGGGGTLGVVSPLKIYLVEKNRLRVLLRYYPWWRIMISPVFTTARYLALALEMGKSAMRESENSGGKTAGRGQGVAEGIGSLLAAYRDFWRGRATDLAVRRQWPGGPAFVEQALRQRLDFESLRRLEAE